MYELNITLFDALNDPRQPQFELDIRRFMASQAIMLSLAGVPGIYFHSLFGSRNSQECLQKTGRSRSINREKFDQDKLDNLLSSPVQHQQQIFSEYTHLLSVRCRHAAFHPGGDQAILHLDPSLFTLERTAPNGLDKVLCMVKVSANPETVRVNLAECGLAAFNNWKDLIQGQVFSAENGLLDVPLQAYQAVWLQPVSE